MGKDPADPLIEPPDIGVLLGDGHLDRLSFRDGVVSPLPGEQFPTNVVRVRIVGPKHRAAVFGLEDGHLRLLLAFLIQSVAVHQPAVGGLVEFRPGLDRRDHHRQQARDIANRIARLELLGRRLADTFPGRENSLPGQGKRDVRGVHPVEHVDYQQGKLFAL